MDTTAAAIKHLDEALVQIAMLKMTLESMDGCQRLVSHASGLWDVVAEAQDLVAGRAAPEPPRKAPAEETTSPEVATLAARGLATGVLTPDETRVVCGSALTQAGERAEPTPPATITENPRLSLSLRIDTHNGLTIETGKGSEVYLTFPSGEITKLTKTEFGHVLDASRSLPPSLCQRWGIPRSAALHDAEVERGEAERLLEAWAGTIYDVMSPREEFPWTVYDPEDRDYRVEVSSGPTPLAALRAAFGSPGAAEILAAAEAEHQDAREAFEKAHDQEADCDSRLARQEREHWEQVDAEEDERERAEMERDGTPDREAGR